MLAKGPSRNQIGTLSKVEGAKDDARYHVVLDSGLSLVLGPSEVVKFVEPPADFEDED